MPGYKVHGDQQDQEDGEAEDPLPANPLKWGDLVFLDYLLLHRHLHSCYPLRQNDEHIARQHHLLVVIAPAPTVEVVTRPDNTESEHDKDHPRPLVPLELVVEEGHREDPSEDDDTAPQHLEAGRKGPCESKVHGGGAGKIAAGGDGPDQGVEFLGAKDADVFISAFPGVVPDLEGKVATHFSNEH